MLLDEPHWAGRAPAARISELKSGAVRRWLNLRWLDEATESGPRMRRRRLLFRVGNSHAP